MPRSGRQTKSGKNPGTKKRPENGEPLPEKFAKRLPFQDQKAWKKWLHKNHARETELWIQMAKVASGIPSITHPEALDVALCYGWIDGQVKPLDESYSLRRFIPRRKNSIWSQINRAKALQLIEQGLMEPAGLAAIEQAKANGRWEAAYQPVRDKSIPADLESALKKNKKAAIFFKSLDSKNRYSIVFRLQTTKNPESRSAKLAKFIAMLQQGEKLI